MLTNVHVFLTGVKLKSDYTTGNMSDIDHNVNYEAEGPF